MLIRRMSPGELLGIYEINKDRLQSEIFEFQQGSSTLYYNRRHKENG